MPSKKSTKKTAGKKSSGTKKAAKKKVGKKSSPKKSQKVSSKTILTKAKKIGSKVLQGAAAGAFKGAAEASAKLADVGPSKDDATK